MKTGVVAYHVEIGTSSHPWMKPFSEQKAMKQQSWMKPQIRRPGPWASRSVRPTQSNQFPARTGPAHEQNSKKKKRPSHGPTGRPDFKG